MIRILLLLVIGALLYRGWIAPVDSAPSQQAANSEQRLILTLRANATNAYGMPWDGLAPGSFGALGVYVGLPLHNPPDLVACVITADTVPSLEGCAVAREGGLITSYCPDHFECRFILTIPIRQPYGVLVLDLDTLLPGEMHELVDAFIVADQHQDTVEVEAALRRAMRVLTPTTLRAGSIAGFGPEMTLRGAEERRRAAPLRRLRPQDCRDKPCTLVQSRLLFGEAPEGITALPASLSGAW